MKKLKILVHAFCICMGLFFVMNASAEESFVYDQADLLSTEEEQKLQKTAQEYHEKWQINFVAVTTEEAKTLSSGEFADSFYDSCYPYAVDDDGCLFLIDMDNQEIYLSTSGKMMDYLNEDEVDLILDDAFERIIDGDYYGTFDAFFDSTGKILEQRFSGSDYQKIENFVYDLADLLTEEEEQKLQAMAEDYHQNWNMNFVAVTTNDSRGMSSKEFADGYYDACYPESDEEDGCLFLIDMDNQEIYLSTSGKMMDYLYDERVESVLDEAYVCVTESNYYGTFQSFFGTTEQYLNQGPIYKDLGNDQQDENIVTNNPQKNQTTDDVQSLNAGPASAFLLAAIIAFLIRRKILKGYKTKFTEHDYESDAYDNAQMSVYDREDRLADTFVNCNIIQSYSAPKTHYHSRPVYYNDRVEPERPVRSSAPSRPHGGDGRSFSNSSSTVKSRSHGGGGRSFSGSSGSRSSGGRSFSGSSGSRSSGGRSFSGSSGSRSSSGKSHGGGGRKF